MSRCECYFACGAVGEKSINSCNSEIFIQMLILCRQNILEDFLDWVYGAMYLSTFCTVAQDVWHRLLAACINMNKRIFFFICLYESCSRTAEHTVQHVQSKATGDCERDYLR